MGFIAISSAFCEEKPSVMGVQTPKMPSIQAVKVPSIGSGFYAPKIDDFYTSATIKNSAKNTNVAKAAEAETKTSEQTLSESLSELTSLSQRVNSILSAQDMSLLDSTGDFSSISNLLAKKNLPSASTLASADISSNVNNGLLNQILAELKDIKNSNATATQAALKLEEIPPPSQITRQKDNAKILRFFVNGYDMLSTCKTIHFSDKENDGTFLLTGDRVYNSNNKARTETFYMLFKAVGNEGGITTYKVAPDVMQDYENKLSFLYQLSAKKNLTAEKTGNLITLKVKEPAWNMDLLIDAGVE